jgi:predicted GTPase
MRILILGAAGRDFHDFNVLWRDDPSATVVAFTAAQIPHVDERRYPAALAGPRYPQGIPIRPERELEALIAAERVDQVAFAYSDVSHAQVMTLAARCQAAGASFLLPGPAATMLRSRLPVIAVCAVRTGCGKSPVSRWVARELRARGLRVAVIRHPMPYGDLERQRVQRFATAADLDAAACTAEEREEYEPHLEAGNLVFAGVDTAQVLAAAEREADVVVWDGGNNDFPFVRPDLQVVLVDAWRPEQASGWYPGEAVLRSADLVVVNKVDTAPAESAALAARAATALNPGAPVVRGRCEVALDDAAAVRGRRVLVVEDGPTLTHGGMGFGAGLVAARAAGAEVVDPRPFAPAELASTLARYPALGPVLPAIGYGAQDLALLARAIDATPADVVVAGTPLDLARLTGCRKPVVRARYAFSEDRPGELAAHLDAFLAGPGRGQPAP